jgi:hypothetical protein
MYLDMNAISYIIGGVLLFFLLCPVLIKQYFANKFRGDKILVRKVKASEEEVPEILKVEGLTTETSKSNRAYVIKGKKQNPQTKEWSGNTFETWYPEGLPRFLQVRIRAMATPEGNPTGINFYGEQKDLKMSDIEVGAIHAEAFSKAAIAASNDASDQLKEIKKLGLGKLINKTVVYIALGVIVIGVLAGVFLAFQNSQAIGELKGFWGW